MITPPHPRPEAGPAPATAASAPVFPAAVWPSAPTAPAFDVLDVLGAQDAAVPYPLERTEPVVYVPDAYGRMVPVLRSQAQALRAAVPATVPRDLTPRPLIDPRAQVVVAAGAGAGAAAAGLGWGLGQVIGPLAAAGAGSALWAVCVAAVVLRLAGGARRSTTYITNTTTVTQSASWWGRNTTAL
ncbi:MULTISPECIES: hypothetical protein [Streptomyces]|uniref:hypothetical protein n=1 Tax=Streptomyces TaxID=1883 RepID=UPI00163BB1D2|nr:MULTISPECIES: hypothetical protein [Streptomyces]MBC2879789.1 hypothetical protein [Streptomyces sp. TYQ1024]UBI41395.1 hypothetical protein K7I03_33565 [Streptomyces mobaraensis]